MQWPIPPFPTKTVNGEDVTLATAGTANTKGSWGTLLTGTTAPAGWICLGTPRSVAAGDRAFLMDLAIGGAGSETIVADNLIVGYRGFRGTTFPLHIPAGATLRGRISGQITSTFMTIRIGAYLSEPESGISTPGKITPYGAVTSTSGGTLLTPASTIGVKGSWAELVSATTRPIHALMVLVQGSTSSQPADLTYAVDIAVGGSGSETIIIPDHCVLVDSTEISTPFSPEFYPLSLCIPAGVRLAARVANRNNGNTTPIEVAVYGFTY